MTIQHHGYAIHAPSRMPFDEGKLALMQWACSLVAHHCRCFAIEGVCTFELAGDHNTTATGSITQANGMAHVLGTPLLGEPNVKGSAPRFSRFFALRASSGGLIICTVRLPSLPA